MNIFEDYLIKIENTIKKANQDNLLELPENLSGINEGASFDAIQEARDKRLIQAEDDQIAKAKIEASYDSLLMDSLKARQLGKVSNAAASASEKEKSLKIIGNDGGSSLLTRIGNLNFASQKGNSKGLIPNLSFPEGQGLMIRLAFGLLALVVILSSPDESIEIILSLSTLGLFISLVRRGRKPLPSLGWSVVFLSTGYILGGLIVSNLELANNHSLLLSIDISPNNVTEL